MIKIKKILKNNFGSINFSYAVILSVCCVVGVAATVFMINIENFQNKSSTNIETQGMVSPSLQIK